MTILTPAGDHLKMCGPWGWPETFIQPYERISCEKQLRHFPFTRGLLLPTPRSTCTPLLASYKMRANLYSTHPFEYWNPTQNWKNKKIWPLAGSITSLPPTIHGTPLLYHIHQI